MVVNVAGTVFDGAVGKVCWGVPLYGSIHTFNVVHLLNHLAYGIGTQTFGLMSLVEGAYVDHARNTIVSQSLAAARSPDYPDLTHLFFQDQDVTLSLDQTDYVVRRLLSLDLPVVGAVYFGRDPDHLPIAFDIEPFARLRHVDLDGVQQVGGIGMGATLINLGVFRQMKQLYEDEWWFRCSESNEGDGRRTGEDIWFAHRCAEMGVPIYLDGSTRCGHVGPVEITYRHWQDSQVQSAQEVR